MAFPHHDPRYAQSPYHFQAPFAPPQQHNPAFGLGHPVAQTPLAPPQAYLTNRPQPQYPPPHPPMNGQPGFPGTFANTGQFQHNAQYNPNMVAGQPHLGYQNPQQIPTQFGYPQPFRTGPPPPPGQMPAMSASSPTNLIPPPPNIPQQAGTNNAMQWQNNPNLPPKPSGVGYREPVELHSRQNSGQLQHSGLPGLGSAGTETGSGHGQQNNSAPGNTLHQTIGNPDQGQQFINRQIHSVMHQNSHQNDLANNTYSPTSPTVVNLSRTEKDISMQNARAEESPDMYSPQLNPQHLPGLGGVSGDAPPPQARESRVASMSKGTDGHYSPPAAISPMIPSKAAILQVQHKAAPAQPAVDPFAIKEQASQALKDLEANNIGFLDIAGNGIHPNVLRNLYLDNGMDLDPAKPKPKEATEQTAATKQSAKSKPVAQKQAPAPAKNPAAQAPSKPLTREEYLAKLKAAKGDKASPPNASNEPSPAPKASEIITIGSDAGSASPPEAKQASPKPPPVKKVDLKSKEQNALIRQRLEALKRSTLEKQQREAQEAAQAASATGGPKQIDVSQSKTASAIKSNGEYTPANPFYASTGSFSGLPGLSMFEDAGSTLPGFGPAGDDEDVHMTGDEAEPGEISDEPEAAAADGELVDESLKRPYDAISEEEPASTIRQIDPRAPAQVVIELSDDEEEEGEVTSAHDRPGVQRQASGTSAGGARDSSQQPQLRARIDALAAHEESIKLYKQKIELLEAKKKAKKAIGSNATPTPSGTPSQSRPLAQIPEAVTSTAPSIALAAAGEKVQAQQDSFVATKSALLERLEKEEARVTMGESTPHKNQREQRIQTLRGSITKLDTEIAQAETEKQRIQQEIERGIKGREEFSKELSELLAEMEAEDAATAPTSELQAPHTQNSDPINQVEAEIEVIDDDAGDDTMDISEDEEGEISDDEDPTDHNEYPVDIREPSDDDHEPAVQNPSRPDSRQGSLSKDDEPADQETYSPQRTPSTSTAENAEMEYEPEDYEPEEYGLMADAGASGATGELDDYEPQAGADVDADQDPSVGSEAEYDPLEAIQETDEHVAGSKASPLDVTMTTSGRVVSVTDSSDNDEESSMGNGSEEGEMLEDYDEGQDNDDEGATHDLADAGLADQDVPDEELAAEDHPPAEDDAEPEEILMEESSESEASNDEGSKATGFRPYESPLAVFKSYRFAPKYAEQVPGGFKSLTFSHRINPQQELCRWELQGGTCANKNCNSQHFKDMTLSDDKLILELGSLNEGTNEEQRDEYRRGLRKVLNDLRSKGVVTNPAIIAGELASYRSRFWGDPSRVITRLHSGL